MPELPEVEMVARRLRAMLPHGTMFNVINVLRGSYLSGDDLENLWHARITGVHRHGKNILISFCSPKTVLEKKRLVVHCHLGMSGYWDSKENPWTFHYVEGKRRADDADVRVLIETERQDGIRQLLRFHDARLFGRLRLIDSSTVLQVGPEIVQTSTQLFPQGIKSGDDLKESLMRRPGWELKRALMDQLLVAGLGNIYASEALHVSRLHPMTVVREVADWDTLFAACQDQLIGALSRDLDYSCLSIYRRKACRKDGTRVQSVKVEGRTSYFCPTCQPPPS